MGRPPAQGNIAGSPSFGSVEKPVVLTTLRCVGTCRRHSAGNQAFTSIGAGALIGAAGQLRVTKAVGSGLVEGDVNGDGAADLTDFVGSYVRWPATSCCNGIRNLRSCYWHERSFP